MRLPSYDIRRCTRSDVIELIEEFHPYGSAGSAFTYAFAVYEEGRPIAAYCWMPPPPGAAKSVCPEEPSGVLALSRMVAVPRCQRSLNHVSKPLRRQMRRLIDRTRWPVLITYSDESLGHTGHVYKCSGWEKTVRNKAVFFTDSGGRRVSRYRNGKTRDVTRHDRAVGFIQRWEHWWVPRGGAADFMASSGWRREATGRVWASGSTAFRFTKDEQMTLI